MLLDARLVDREQLQQRQHLFQYAYRVIAHPLADCLSERVGLGDGFACQVSKRIGVSLRNRRGKF